MGLASGAILATQATEATQETNAQNQGMYLAGNHCGNGSCAGQTPPTGSSNLGTPPKVTPASGNLQAAKPVNGNEQTPSKGNGSCSNKNGCHGKEPQTPNEMNSKGNKTNPSAGSSKKENDVGYNVAKQHHHQKYTGNNQKGRLLQDNDTNEDSDEGNDEGNEEKTKKEKPGTVNKGTPTTTNKNLRNTVR